MATLTPTRQRTRHNTAASLPGLSDVETHILQLRAQGMSYRAIQARTGVAPRKAWDLETAALTKLLAYVESQHFLQGNKP
jgi:DNA-binding CsgD family transcriptional regulator